MLFRREKAAEQETASGKQIWGVHIQHHEYCGAILLCHLYSSTSNSWRLIMFSEKNSSQTCETLVVPWYQKQWITSFGGGLLFGYLRQELIHPRPTCLNTSRPQWSRHFLLQGGSLLRNSNELTNVIISWYLAPRRNALHFFDRACTRQSSIPQSHMSHGTVDIVTMTWYLKPWRGGRLWRPFPRIPRAKRIDIDHQHFPVCLAWEVAVQTSNRTHIAIQNSQKAEGAPQTARNTWILYDFVIFFTHVGLCTFIILQPSCILCILQPLPEGSWPSSIRQTAPKTRHRTMVPTWRHMEKSTPGFPVAKFKDTRPASVGASAKSILNC